MTFGALRQRHAAPGAGSQRTRSRKALVIPDLSMGDLLSDRHAQRVYSRANHRQMTFGALRQRHAAPGAGSQRNRSRRLWSFPTCQWLWPACRPRRGMMPTLRTACSCRYPPGSATAGSESRDGWLCSSFLARSSIQQLQNDIQSLPLQRSHAACYAHSSWQRAVPSPSSLAPCSSPPPPSASSPAASRPLPPPLARGMASPSPPSLAPCSSAA